MIAARLTLAYSSLDIKSLRGRGGVRRWGKSVGAAEDTSEVYEVYCAHCGSMHRERQEGLASLVADAEQKQSDIVLITERDRPARDPDIPPKTDNQGEFPSNADKNGGEKTTLRSAQNCKKRP